MNWRNQYSHTPKEFRAILIDPEIQQIREIKCDGSYEATRELVKAKGLDHFRIADFEGSWDYGWIDDCGLARGEPVYAFNFLAARKDPVAGKCLLLGVTKEGGKNCDAKFAISSLTGVVRWLGLILPEVTWMPEEHGLRSVVTYKRVQ